MCSATDTFDIALAATGVDIVDTFYDGDPPTQLALRRNSPGYRLILNNILFPAAKKQKRKT